MPWCECCYANSASGEVEADHLCPPLVTRLISDLRCSLFGLVFLAVGHPGHCFGRPSNVASLHSLSNLHILGIGLDRWWLAAQLPRVVPLLKPGLLLSLVVLGNTLSATCWRVCSLSRPATGPSPGMIHGWSLACWWPILQPLLPPERRSLLVQPAQPVLDPGAAGVLGAIGHLLVYALLGRRRVALDRSSLVGTCLSHHPSMPSPSSSMSFASNSGRVELAIP